jgi:hypothetical protein
MDQAVFEDFQGKITEIRPSFSLLFPSETVAAITPGRPFSGIHLTIHIHCDTRYFSYHIEKAHIPSSENRM